MTDWPVALPQVFLLNSYSAARPSRAIRSQPEAGPAIVRRRFSAAVMPFQGDMVMSRAQRDAFVEFFDETLDGGVGEFQFPAQDGSTDIWTCRFTAEPTEEWLSAAHWRISMAMELLPGGVTVVAGAWGWDDTNMTFDNTSYAFDGSQP